MSAPDEHSSKALQQVGPVVLPPPIGYASQQYHRRPFWALTLTVQVGPGLVDRDVGLVDTHRFEGWVVDREVSTAIHRRSTPKRLGSSEDRSWSSVPEHDPSRSFSTGPHLLGVLAFKPFLRASARAKEYIRGGPGRGYPGRPAACRSGPASRPGRARNEHEAGWGAILAGLMLSRALRVPHGGL